MGYYIDYKTCYKVYENIQFGWLLRILLKNTAGQICFRVHIAKLILLHRWRCSQTIPLDLQMDNVRRKLKEIGRASCRERVCQYV